MKSLYARGVVLALGLVCLAPSTQAQEPFGSPSLLALPATSHAYPGRQVAHENLWAAPETSPVSTDQNAPPRPPADESVISGDYKAAMTNESCTSTVCGNGACGCCQNNWFVYGGALLMTREYGHKFNVSFDTGPPADTVICSCHNDMDYSGGFEITAGRTFNCGCNALAVTYWGLYPSDQEENAFGSNMVGNLNANLDFSGLDYDNGGGAAGMDLYFDDALRHRVTTSNNIQNVEVNLLGGCCGITPWSCGYGECCGQRLSCNWVAGVRYFQFDENFSLGADTVDTSFDGGLDEVYYDVETENTLWGVQIGGGVNYCINPCWSVYSNGKAGVFGNNMDIYQRVYGSNGGAVVNNGTYLGDSCAINTGDTRLAVMGQIDSGIKWQISCRWSATIGYRVLGVSGVALLSEQIPTDLTNLGAMREVDSSGSLLLHGGYLGAQFCF